MPLQRGRYVHLFDRSDSVLAFNSLTLESWELEPAEAEALRRPEALPTPHPTELTPLVEAGLLVNDVDEHPEGSALSLLREHRRERATRGQGSFTTLRLALTERCNMACTYCFQQRLYPDSQPRMSAEELDRQLHWFIDQAPGRSVTVQYFGGEPMLEWDLIVRGDELLAAAVAAGRIEGYRQTMTTNGTLLTPQRCSWLFEHGFDLIFSFDGPPEINDALRVLKNGRGTFEKAAEGLRMWRDHGGEPAILMTATPENVRHLPRYVRWFLDESGLGVGTLALNSPQPTTSGWETGGAELADAVFEIWQECVNRDVDFHGPGTFIPLHLRSRTPRADHCVDGDTFGDGSGAWPMYVSASGRRSLCLVHHNDDRVIAPSGQEHDLGRSWHSTDDDVPDCDRCVASQLCGGPCALEKLLWGPGLNRDRCEFIRTMTGHVLSRT